MARVMMVVNVLGGAGLAAAFFLAYSDRSAVAVVQWAIFYTVAILLPLWWSRDVRLALRELREPPPPGLRRAVAYPVLAGLLTLVAAVTLLRAAHAP